MKIILSPAKKMRVDTDSLQVLGSPAFIEESKKLLGFLREKNYAELKAIWKCNDAIAEQNLERIRSMDLEHNLTPAIIAYDGIAFQYMAPSVFESQELDYVEEHLRILSAFYGILHPLDGVVPYRLEMQAKAKPCGAKDLYDFWSDKLYKELVYGDSKVQLHSEKQAESDKDLDATITTKISVAQVSKSLPKEGETIINLASKEYSKCIEKYLRPQDHFITVDFCEKGNGGKLVTKGTYAKMARGEMVRFMAQNGVTEPSQIKAFDRLGYVYRNELSGESRYVFERIAN